MNFIDFNNEYDAICNGDPYSYESPIAGMSDEVYQQIINEEFSNEDAEQQQCHSVITKLITKRVVVESSNVCAICLKNYRKNELLFQLPCTHHFHTVCMEPWLLKSPQCP